MFYVTQRTTVKTVLVLCFGLFVSPLFSETYFVTTTADDGAGSLREAIRLANVNPGPDEIIFQIPMADPNYNPATGVWTIKPLTQMRTISDSNLVINGMTQRDFIGEDTNPFGPEIELNGTLSTYASGLNIESNHIQIFHLIINRFSAMGIFLSGTKECMIAGCYLGVNYNAMESAGNQFGIFMDDSSQYNMIVPMDTLPNVIGGNPWGGIKIARGCSYNAIVGNYIGLNRTGTDTLGNGLTGGYGGISILEGSHHNEVVENMIFGKRVGIGIWESNYNNIVNNCIGVDRTWTLNLGNVDSGISIRADVDSAKKNLIAENFIGYHPFSGIYIEGQKAAENTMTRNFISNNGQSGITLAQNSNNNISNPTLTSGTSEQVQGTAVPMSVIEVFTDSGNQGRQYLGSTTSGASGSFVLEISGMPLLGNITATVTDTNGNTSMFSLPYAVSTNVKQTVLNPVRFSLEQNYPNPFNPSTKIQFTISELGFTILKVYDVLGNEVAKLVNEEKDAGSYEVKFNSHSGEVRNLPAGRQGLPSGIYFYRLQVYPANGGAGSFVETKKMVLLK
ncbi:MAG: hypothetical protein WBH40_15760 [Ignavibacteriaceae bacterium]